MTFETKFRSLVGRSPEMEKYEIVSVLRELLVELNNEQKVRISGWKGKSSFEMKDLGDTIYVEKYKRDDQDSEAKPQTFEIEVSELNGLKQLILRQFRIKSSDFITSRELGEYFYNTDWDNGVFAKRKRHNHFNIMLNVLDKKGFITYRGGKIYPR